MAYVKNCCISITKSNWSKRVSWFDDGNTIENFGFKHTSSYTIDRDKNYICKMLKNKTTEIIEDLRNGKMVIILDDEDRENEGDLICAAEAVTPEIINFMATHVVLYVWHWIMRKCKKLNLKPMTSNNMTSNKTAFTVSIEAKEGITTGISAKDRAHHSNSGFT